MMFSDSNPFCRQHLMEFSENSVDCKRGTSRIDMNTLFSLFCSCVLHLLIFISFITSLYLNVRLYSLSFIVRVSLLFSRLYLSYLLISCNSIYDLCLFLYIYIFFLALRNTFFIFSCYFFFVFYSIFFWTFNLTSFLFLVFAFLYLSRSFLFF